MTKKLYIQPSVEATALAMVLTLCASGTTPSSGTLNLNPDGQTNIQL